MKFTLDDAAVQLVQLEWDDAAGAAELRERLTRLARRRAIPASVRAEVRRAAEALAVVARGDADAAQALAAANRHVEAAMRASYDSAASSGTHDSPSKQQPPADRPTEPAIDPLMLAGLAALEMEETGDAAGTFADAAGEHEEAKSPQAIDGSADADPELLESFVVESLEYLQSAESALLLLEADPTNVEAVNTVFRCFHTIKGTAAFLGLTRLSEVAHLAESLLSRVRDREIVLEGQYANLALRAVDVLEELVRAVAATLEGKPFTEPATCAPLLRALADPDTGLDGDLLADKATERDTSSQTESSRLQLGGASAEAWIRVRTDRLDRLVDTIGELVIAHAMIAQDSTLDATHDDRLARKVAHATKIVRELQDLSISMRMVPLRGVMQKLSRVVRDAAVKSGKQVNLIVEGEETEIDRNTVDVIADPLVHMVRNAVDHGIELPAERERAGKPAAGTIRISASHAGGSVVISLSDDGHGLDRARILAKAVSRGIVDEDRGLSDREIFELIFAPGFSTAETVTDLSGRGVGMDVVRRSVESLQGRIDIESESGEGSTFSIRLPLTMAITDGMLVRIGEERYIVPTINIQLSFRAEPDMLFTVAGRGEMVRLRDDVLPIVRLSRVLGIDGAATEATEGLLMVIGSGERRCALLVDELLGQQQVVAKSLGDGIGRVAGISGGAILGDGRVGLILDLAEIMTLARQTAADARAA